MIHLAAVGVVHVMTVAMLISQADTMTAMFCSTCATSPVIRCPIVRRDSVGTMCINSGTSAQSFNVFGASSFLPLLEKRAITDFQVVVGTYPSHESDRSTL